MHTEDTPRAGGSSAARRLAANGLASLVLPDGRAMYMLDPATERWLDELRAYIGSSDPLMIGAAAILEAEGYERSQPSLFEAQEDGHA